MIMWDKRIIIISTTQVISVFKNKRFVGNEEIYVP